ncbi:MAG: hypothetical protein ACUVWO_08945 [Thermodesulfobacteriota bacterium]
MKSKVTIGLPDHLEEDLSALTKRLRLKRSDIVGIALQRFIEKHKIVEEMTPYERVADMIGTVSSGIPDLGEAHGKYLLKREKDA